MKVENGLKCPKLVLWWARINSVAKYRVGNYKFNKLGMDYGIT